MLMYLDIFVVTQHGKANSLVGLIGIFWFNRNTVLGFSFYLWDSLTRELLLGLLGWGEKRRSVIPLSESPLGQPLVPGSD